MHPIAIYTYDAGGERIIKHNSTNVAIYENALKVGEKTDSDFMLYPSGMLVARPASDGTGGLTYTKHYFAGTQRVSSKIGSTTNLGKFLQEWQQQEQTGPSYPAITTQAQMTKTKDGVDKVYTAFGINYTTPAGNTSFVPIAAFTHSPANEGKEIEQYYFHPDHLGSSNYITNFAGNVSQHSEYFAFGETFIEEHLNSHNSPYKYNGKELDEESGLYYYGARYYDPRISIWASVDPLAEKMPIWSPYSYCYQNPIKFKDKDGLFPFPINPFWLENMLLGIAAHTFLSGYVTLKGGGWEANYENSGAKKGGLFGIADVVHISGAGSPMIDVSVFELKPISNSSGQKYTNAQNQLGRYVTGISRDLIMSNPKSSVSVHTGTLGHNLPFQGVLPATITTGLFDYDIEYTIPNPSDGMIYYTVLDKRISEPVQNIIKSLVQAACIVGILFMVKAAIGALAGAGGTGATVAIPGAMLAFVFLLAYYALTLEISPGGTVSESITPSTNNNNGNGVTEPLKLPEDSGLPKLPPGGLNPQGNKKESEKEVNRSSRYF